MNVREIITLNMQPNLLFLFSGSLLTHMKLSNNESDTDNETFLNVASYVNKMFTETW